jgi:hypothetical protein
MLWGRFDSRGPFLKNWDQDGTSINDGLRVALLFLLHPVYRSLVYNWSDRPSSGSEKRRRRTGDSSSDNNLRAPTPQQQTEQQGSGWSIDAAIPVLLLCDKYTLLVSCRRRFYNSLRDIRCNIQLINP